MADFSGLLDRICLDWLNRADLRAEAKRAVWAAIRSFEANRFWFNETATALTCTSSQGYVTAPTNLLSLDRLELTQNSCDIELAPLAFPELRDMRAARPTGRPTHYTYWADRFELAVIPDSAYSLPCYYIKQLPALSADTDTNEWTTFGENLIAHTAAADLLIGVLQGSNDAIQRHAAAATLGRRELDQQNDQRLLRRIRPTRF